MLLCRQHQKVRFKGPLHGYHAYVVCPVCVCVCVCVSVCVCVWVCDTVCVAGQSRPDRRQTASCTVIVLNTSPSSMHSDSISFANFDAAFLPPTPLLRVLACVTGYLGVRV